MPEAIREINPSTGPVASFHRGKSFEADPDSVEFRKERGTEDRRLFAVSFSDGAGNDWFLGGELHVGNSRVGLVRVTLPTEPG
jgi:hypothetical protein